MINGMQHIGIGVQNREESYKFYNNALLFSVPMSKHEGYCSGVVPIIEHDETRNVIISMNPYGGAAVEVFQYTSKTPVPVPAQVDFLYNGYLFYGVPVKNIEKAVGKVLKNKGRIITDSTVFTPMKDKGWKTAVFTDPFGVTGIMVEYPESFVGYGEGTTKIGGVDYIAIGVSDIERSVDFYKNMLDYDVKVYSSKQNSKGIFEGECPEWDGLFGKGRKIKRALLVKSEKPQGTFKHFLKGGMIELIEAEGNTGKHSYDGRKWGDIGFMELCFDVSDIQPAIDALVSKGADLAVPVYTQDMGQKTEASFAYIRDPDGSLIEFAEIKRLPMPYWLIRLLVNPTTVKFLKFLKLL
jgi:catechol 2,3-dioxygenase-like lactoylglutathione lyase family enzyme